MAHMPLAATFILFDFVVHNPIHPKTRKNLSFLDMSAGYFSRMEMTTDGNVPCCTIAEFSHIARRNVSAIQTSRNQQGHHSTSGNAKGSGI